MATRFLAAIKPKICTPLRALRNCGRLHNFSSTALATQQAAIATARKQAAMDLYYKENPLAYIESLAPLDYGQFQDTFVNFAKPMIDELRHEKSKQKKQKKLKIVDLGCLYGNSSLALIEQLSWNETISFWLNTEWEANNIKNKDDYYVVGVDYSENALLYGLQKSIYDEIFVLQDFNKDLTNIDSLKKHIMDADILMCLMVGNYMNDEIWSNIVNKFFLKKKFRHRKNKLLFYNQVCLFQNEDISPKMLLNNQNNWYSKELFTKHRLLTPQESAKTNSNKESWTYLYGVMCNNNK